MQRINVEFTDYLTFWLMWIAILPVGLIAAFLASIPVHFVVMNTFDGDFIQLSESGLRAVEYAGYAFAFPIAFIWAGSWMAPAGRPHVVALLAILWVSVWALVYLYVLVLTNDETIELDVPRAVASVVLGLVGVGVGGVTAHQRWAVQ